MPSQPLLRVRDWEHSFESAKSKTYGIKSQTYMPNKFGLGYHRIMAEPDGPAVYGAWCALVCILSRAAKPRQGYLTDTTRTDGIPYSPQDIAHLTSVPVEIVERMLSVVSASAGWIETCEAKDTAGIPQGYYTTPLPYPHPYPHPLPDTPQPPKGGNARSRKASKPAGSTETPDAAEAIYALYPRKVGKGQAIKAIAKAIHATGDPGMLRDRVAAYAEAVARWSDGDRAFVPHPATWFNACRWEDDPKEWERKPRQGTNGTGKPWGGQIPPEGGVLRFNIREA